MEQFFQGFGWEDEEELMHGVYTGFVTDNKDPENLGRVKVKVPIIDDQKELGWSRVSTFMGGDSRGALFIPEIGDEVIIAFLLGDIRSPIVIGSLWNNVEKPPEGKNDQNDIRKIKTRAGHEVIFNDVKKDGGITIKTSAGHQIQLDDKQKNIEIKTSSGAQVLKMDGQGGSITVNSGTTKITIGKDGPIKLESKGEVSVKGLNISLQADNKLELKANSTLDLNCSGMIKLQGSMIKLN